MGEEILKVLTPIELFKIPMPGFNIPVTDVVVATWFIMAAIIGMAWLLTSKLKEIPGKKQAMAEVIVDTINNSVKDQVGHHYKMVAPYVGSILLFLIIANTVSIFNIIPNWEQLHKLTGWEFFENIPQFRLLPPTRNVNVTAALGIMSIFSVIIFSIRAKGFFGWLKGFKKPMGIMLPFNILDYIIRPLSLCFRLFGNVLGGVIIMELIYIVLPVGVPVALSFFFDIFDGLLQAYVFTFLTTMYISDAVEE
jgi:F-type H+-transporting ATPase subunit a